MLDMTDHQIEVLDILHGNPVLDPYRWLEDRSLPATEAWIVEQNQRLDAYRRGLGELDAIQHRIQGYLDAEATDQVGRVGDLYFYRTRKLGRQQASIYVSPTADRSERVLVDPEPFGPFAFVGIHRVSFDGKLLAYEMKYGGEHSKAIHIVDVENGVTWSDCLERGLARGFGFRQNADGFYYCHEFGSVVQSRISAHQIMLHRRGAQQHEDDVLLQLPRKRSSKLLLRSTEELLIAIYCHQINGIPMVDLYATQQDNHFEWVPILSNVRSPFAPFVHRGRLFAHRMDEASNGEIVEINALDGSVTRVIVPETGLTIRDCVVGGDRFFVTYLKGMETRIAIWSIDGQFAGYIPLTPAKTWTLLSNHSNEAVELFLQCESFTDAPSLHRFQIDNGSLTEWSRSAMRFPRGNFVQRQLQYPSKDNTTIDLSLIWLGEESDRKARPVIMTGYGASGITLRPQFSIFVSILLELGFAFAIPAIRGGEERGRQWHEAARGRKKQVAFDDFTAAADWLIREGYTTAGQLAIFGGSFSGLLVGVAMCQKPHLFGAVLCIAPLLDMLRYHLFDRAAVWSSEYGTADDVEEFNALIQYSPYHHVRTDVDYPPTLFVCGDQDTRCNAAHVRKMAARLQRRHAQRRAIIVDHSAMRGHAATLPVAAKVESMAIRIGFLCKELGIPMTEGAEV